MDKTQAFEKLRIIGQQHLFQYFDTLSPTEQKKILDQIESLNIPMFRQQQLLLEQTAKLRSAPCEPFRDFLNRGNEKDFETGLKLLAEGKVGCILIAGGQGTRLKLDGPKGMVPVSIIKKKSLFQLFAEKTAAAGKLAKRKLPLAIMTSPQNHEMTESFFKANRYFNLDPSQVTFFSQGMLPLLDEKGNLFLDNKGHMAEGPNGNGSSLGHFCQSGIWEAWYAQGVRYVNFVLVDNPLADPFDAEMIGVQHNEIADVVIKAVERTNPDEKVGVIVKRNRKIEVVEYSELSADEKRERDERGGLKHRCANLSLFSFSMDFIKRAAKTEMPLHPAHKAVPYLDKNGNRKEAEQVNAWKFEKFIFDVLPLALKVKALIYPREECFAPLKNFAGEDSLTQVQSALQNRDREIIQQLSGVVPPDFSFELSQDFYYPTDEFRNHWRGRRIEKEGYIGPDI